MKNKYLFLLCLIVHLPCIASKTPAMLLDQKVDAISNDSFLSQNLNTLSLMTSSDLSSNRSSNLNLTNNTGQALTVYGVHFYGVSWILPGQDCINGIIQSGGNFNQQSGMEGTVVTPIPFAVGQSIPIGENYLYNMIYNWIFWRYASNNHSIPCFLPGCSWAGDPGPFNWCLQVGITSPDSYYTGSPYKSNTAPFAWPPNLNSNGDGGNYSYDLIPNFSNFVWLGPFTCSDQTLTCSTPIPLYQSFPAA